MEESSEIYTKIIFQDYEKHIQVRLCINEFRGIEYLHLRKYYQDFDEEWKPSSEGISMPLDIDNAKLLFEGTAEIISLAESKEIIEEYFGELIGNIYQK
jgi:hypothetical protein